MILLYAASTIYHTVDSTEKVNRQLRKIDHMMIFVLIAGSYTPVCLIVLQGTTGYLLCGAVWAVAIIGIIIKACWINCPKWFSSVIYIGMGWLCVFAFVPIVHSLPSAGFGWLLAGGIIYTVGGIIYALKLPIFNSHHKNFGSHEIFHLFVMGGRSATLLSCISRFTYGDVTQHPLFHLFINPIAILRCILYQIQRLVRFIKLYKISPLPGRKHCANRRADCYLLLPAAISEY